MILKAFNVSVDTVGQILAEHVSNHGNNNGHACDFMLYDMRGSWGPYNHVPDPSSPGTYGQSELAFDHP